MKKYLYQDALKVANEIKDWLAPYCTKIAIAGSLRRRKAEVGDIEILVVPNPLTHSLSVSQDWVDFRIRDLIADGKLNYRLNSKGSRVYGKQNKLLVHCASGIPVDIFSTTETNWATALVVRTGSKQSNIKICMEAKKQRLKFNAYGSGFTKADGSKIVCHSEREVFETAGLPYLEPERR